MSESLFVGLHSIREGVDVDLAVGKDVVVCHDGKKEVLVFKLF